MTTLQEASTKALDALRRAMQDNLDFDVALEAFEALRTALAQQREQQPVCHGCGIPAGDVHMSTCKSGKWPSRVSNGDTAAPAPQAQHSQYGSEDLQALILAKLTAPQAQEPVQEKRPMNCGTGHCSCIECLFVPAPQPAQDALQDIAAYIGVGGYNGATTEQLSERIRVEFDRLAAMQSAQPVAQPRDLTDEEILSLEKQTPAMNDAGEEWIYFARAVLKKARE